MKNLEQQGEAARRAARVMMTASTGQKNEALAGMAQALLDGCADILAANREDLEAEMCIRDRADMVSQFEVADDYTQIN